MRPIRSDGPSHLSSEVRRSVAADSQHDAIGIYGQRHLRQSSRDGTWQTIEHNIEDYWTAHTSLRKLGRMTADFFEDAAKMDLNGAAMKTAGYELERSVSGASLFETLPKTFLMTRKVVTKHMPLF